MNYAERLKTAGRNDPCPCGSGKKYKKCHLAKDEAAELKALKKLEQERARATTTEGKQEEKDKAPESASREHGNRHLTNMSIPKMRKKDKFANIRRTAK